MIKYLFVFWMLIPSVMMAQGKKVSSIENQVTALVEAMVSADEAQLKNLTSPSLTYGHSNGLIENQSEYVQALVSGESNFTDIKIENQTVDIVKNIAMVRHRLIGKTHNRGASPAPVELGVLLVWQKSGKNWVLLARQAFK